MTRINRLKPLTIASLKEPGRHSDGQNLYLVVDRSGAKRWVFIYRWRTPGQTGPGRLREMGLGSLQKVDLKTARAKAAEARALLGEGKDPLAIRALTAALPTFGEVAEEWIKNRESAVRSDKSPIRWRRALFTYAAALCPLRIDAVETRHVLDVLKPIWETKQVSAEDARSYIERVLDAAKARGWRSGENPARWRGHLDHLLPRPTLKKRHFEALPYQKVPAFMQSLVEAGSVASKALIFTVLTASRPGNVRQARWREIDWDAAVWTIADEYMKAGRTHQVPLSGAAMAVLNEMKDLLGCEPDALIFPGERSGRPLSNMTLNRLMQRQGLKATPHGFRSAFRDWAGNETGYPRELAEESLAHVIGDATEQAYRRQAALERRRPLMADWALHCLSSG